MLKDLNVHVPSINERARVPMEAILAVVDHIAQMFDPEKIILFGSYAYGEPKPWSDVDLLVVAETEDPKQLQKEIVFSFQAPFSMDILVRTPQEIAHRISLGDFFLREIVNKGETLYEREATPLSWSIAKMTDVNSEPNSYVMEWVQKAEGDFVGAKKLLDLQLETLTDIICFHCQQCAEKYLKAYLSHYLIEFPRTHDLLELSSFCQQQDSTFAKISPELRALNNYSVEIRYPGRFTSIEEAEEAVKIAGTVRTFIRPKLGL